MIRRQRSTRFVLALLSLSLSLGALDQTPVLGQITTAATGNSLTTNFAGANFSSSNLTATDASGVTILNTNLVQLRVTGDWDLNLPRTADAGSVSMIAYLPFGVGDFPVQISAFSENVNAKWANGGGNATVPSLTTSVYSDIFEQVGAARNILNDVHVAGAQISPVVQITGNGYQVYGPNQVNGTPSTYVLAAHRNYYLQVYAFSGINTAGFDASTPSITVTNEFGGTWGDGFQGYITDFYWVKVPEPSTVVLGAIGGVGLVAMIWRRRPAVRPRRARHHS